MNTIMQFASKLMKSLATNAASEVHKFHGGVHPDEHKHESTTRPIAQLPIPETLTLPLRQHVGYIPKLKVKVGDYVLKGEMLAEAEGTVSAAIHAPTSGTITAIAEAVIPHPSGLPDICVSLQPDGKDLWKPLTPIDWKHTAHNELITSLRTSGIVGLGGATFPTHIKLRKDGASAIHTLIINAAECEPYITCDDMLMRERADEIIQGIAIAQHLLRATAVVIGIEDNKPAAAHAMTAASQTLANVTVTTVPTLYPSGDARRLIHLLLGVEVPHHKRSTEVGIQVFNVATVLALYRYFTFGEPSVSRIVTVTGNVASPQNFEVLLGTPMPLLIAAAGGAKADTTHYVMGGPMMGFDLPSLNVPVTKAANCIIAASPNLFAPPPPAQPCIRCTRCADACPVNLQPQELYWFAKSDNFEKARDYKLFDCIECGCCTYVCPSNIPLVQYYRYAKSEIIALDKAQEAADLARERNDFRLARIEREKMERAQKHAERAAAAKNNAAQPESAEADKAASNPDAVEAKKAAIAAAVERARALKLAAASGDAANAGNEQPLAEQSSNETKPDSTTIVDSDAQAKIDKKALIAAAMERAKAQKLAAAQIGAAPKNTENLSAKVKAEIDEIEAIRAKAQQMVQDKTPD
ncbi:electron transport complex subunit RsxC [Methylotenera mobilis]|uniref:Ion-translocating oxidoreductase complex subunit C n=1 Tax=Methylotenera mobilis (strain JLW8 / ATCC BAA-1282 / DSM 17540) TaxID=583345 RepID=C6WYE0_METML|nr:electron transport complex subunit RsxC [Methylotenera mobilis]ACT48859.1 electron transport complex, RnfABCDGE type, C subunit [Methylotenera mobilis JLW8]